MSTNAIINIDEYKINGEPVAKSVYFSRIREHIDNSARKIKRLEKENQKLKTENEQLRFKLRRFENTIKDGVLK